MPSVALIGPDGAGKTTLTRRLVEDGMVPCKYLYMGVDLAAGNVVLPTSRLAVHLKRRWPGGGAAGGIDSSVSGGNGRNRSLATRLRAAARLTNRLAEEWYRHAVSRYYQWRGFVVVYDRHFVFDFAPEISDERTLEKRLHRWLLQHVYPRPDLVLFLDAPGDVLFARKGESTPDELERRRQGFLRQQARLANFVRVDATRPLDEVYREVAGHVARLVARRP